MITECPFCDSLHGVTEVTVNHFFCRDCGEKWVEALDEQEDGIAMTEYLKEYRADHSLQN